MREIKFRAYDKEHKKMYYTFNPVCHAEWNFFEFTSAYHAFYEHSTKHSNKAILMQFTGLKDKNGKEIYEGDIVKAHYFYDDCGENLGVTEAEEEVGCIVKYVNENTAFGLFPIKSEDEGYIEPARCSDEGIEIIGNIYENPELMEGK